MCVKELENTSLVCGSDSDLESSDNPTPAPAVELDLLHERAVLFDFLAKTNIESDDSETVFVLTVSIRPRKERNLNVARAVI